MSAFKLRDYQAEDVDAITESFKEFSSALYVAATGLGKTVVMTEVVERNLEKGKRTLMLAHRGELIWQARNAFLARGIEVDIEKAELAASNSMFNRAPVVIATVQTLMSGSEEVKRMHRFKPEDFGLLLYDECHHGVSPSNKKIVEYFTKGNPELRCLGVTATPDRADEEALGQIFETVAAERDILFGVNNGWLIEPHQQMVHVNGLDFSQMRTTAGDLNGADLAKAMEAEEAIQGVVMPTLEAMYRLPAGSLMNVPTQEWGQYLGDLPIPRRTIIFTVSVAQAEMLANVMNRVVPELAAWLCGKTPPDRRQEIFREFDSSKIHALVNCGVTTEGYDNPAVELIVVARPTKSRSLYAQMIGRGTRPLKGTVDGDLKKAERLEAIAASPKPIMTVLDFAGNSGKHKLICTADILGGNVSDEAKIVAKLKAERANGPVNMKQLLEEEEKKLQELREAKRLADEAKRAKLVARVQYTTSLVDPFNAFDLSPVQPRAWDSMKELSDKQKGILLKQGINPDTMTYSQGRQVLNEMFRRWGNKLCTMKQANTLKRFYPTLETHDLPMKQASAMLDALAKNGWRKPSNFIPES
jgi:superfamily II DNA or RNA helicase